MHNLLPWDFLLPYCCLAAALALSILLCVSINKMIVQLSHYQQLHMEASPARYKPMKISKAITGKSPITSTRLSQRIRLPDYPRHHGWKSKGARCSSKRKGKKMFRLKLLTLSTIRRKRIAISTASNNKTRTNESNPVPVSKEALLPESSYS